MTRREFATLRRSVVCRIWLIFALTSPVHAQTARITFEPAPTMPPIVDDRPSITDWVANVQGASLVEGRMELEIVANGQFLGRVVTDELVLTGADQKVRILLPAFNWFVGVDEVLVNLKFHTKDGVLVLPQQRLRTSLPYKKKFPLLLGETLQRPRSTYGRDVLADRLRFESLLPDWLKERAITVMSHLSANDFPQESLAYCHYEAVAVPGDVFAALRSPQLDALLKWVKAGGSLYVEPQGVLPSAQVEFLNQLAASDERGLVFALDDKGRLPASHYLEGPKLLRLNRGLGSAVLAMPDEVPLSEDDWRSVAAALWKIRPEALASFANIQAGANPQDPFAPGGVVGGGGMFNSAYGFATGLEGASLSDVAANMVDWLRPQGVRMVPLWVIGLLLGTLVILIGPVDFLVLGWLKRRKWTWITFPAAILVTTVLTISITNAYLSSAEARKALVVHDIGDGNEIVRSNRFELVFTSATRRLNTLVHGALFTPLLTGGTVDPRYYGRAVAAGQQVVLVPGPNGQMIQTIRPAYGAETTYSEPVSLQGRVPTRYLVTQDVRQWTPQLNRWFSIGQPAEGTNVDMSAIAALSVRSDGEVPANAFQEMLAQVRTRFGPKAEIAILTPQGLLWNSEQITYRPEVSGASYQPYPSQPFSPQLHGASHRYHPFSVGPITAAVQRLTVAQTTGLWSLTSGTSPHGGRSLDDLPLTFTNAADRWWAIVTVPQGDDVVVYRKSFAYSRR